MSLKHGYTDPIADVPADAVAGKVLPSDWNAEHTFPGAGAGEVVFVDGSGHAATSSGFKFDGSQLILPGNADLGALFIASKDAIADYDTFQFKLANVFIVDFGATPFFSPTGDYVNGADIGAVGFEFRSGYFGTSVIVPAIGPSAGELMTLPAANAAGVLNDGNGNLSWVGV